jgi:hypothetical protein
VSRPCAGDPGAAAAAAELAAFATCQTPALAAGVRRMLSEAASPAAARQLDRPTATAAQVLLRQLASVRQSIRPVDRLSPGRAGAAAGLDAPVRASSSDTSIDPDPASAAAAFIARQLLTAPHLPGETDRQARVKHVVVRRCGVGQMLNACLSVCLSIPPSGRLSIRQPAACRPGQECHPQRVGMKPLVFDMIGARFGHELFLSSLHQTARLACRGCIIIFSAIWSHVGRHGRMLCMAAKQGPNVLF